MSAFIEKILNFKVIILATLALVALEVHYLHGLSPRSDYIGLILATALPLVVALSKLEVSWSLCRGHATTHKRKKIGGFPVIAVLTLSALFIVCIGGMVLSMRARHLGFGLFASASMLFFFSNLLIGATVSSLRWKFILYYRYWAGSQIDLLSELEHRNVDPATVAKILKYNKDEGFVVTDTPVPHDAMH